MRRRRTRRDRSRPTLATLYSAFRFVYITDLFTYDCALKFTQRRSMHSVIQYYIVYSQGQDCPLGDLVIAPQVFVRLSAHPPMLTLVLLLAATYYSRTADLPTFCEWENARFQNFADGKIELIRSDLPFLANLPARLGLSV